MIWVRLHEFKMLDITNTVAYGSGMWVRMYDVWVLWEGHGMIHILLTGRTVRIYQYWTYGHGQEGMFMAWG
jgi:hypothetical protein